jgi:hypothetical protein
MMTSTERESSWALVGLGTAERVALQETTRRPRLVVRSLGEIEAVLIWVGIP